MTIYKTKRTDMMFIYKDLAQFKHNTMFLGYDCETYILRFGELRVLTDNYVFKFGR